MQQKRNLLATLLLSQGTPMLVAGDEFGRTQNGNNNAYCQDNPTSWVDWQWPPEGRALFEFTKRLLRIRREHPALQRSKFFQGRDIHGSDLPDLAWLRHDGQPMSERDWNDPGPTCLAMFLAGRGIDEVDEMDASSSTTTCSCCSTPRRTRATSSSPNWPPCASLGICCSTPPTTRPWRPARPGRPRGWRRDRSNSSARLRA